MERESVLADLMCCWFSIVSLGFLVWFGGGYGVGAIVIVWSVVPCGKNTGVYGGSRYADSVVFFACATFCGLVDLNTARALSVGEHQSLWSKSEGLMAHDRVVLPTFHLVIVSFLTE